MNVHPELPVSTFDLNSGDQQTSLQRYYDICLQAQDLMVTTSCFSVWKKGSSTNGSAKVIPAVPGSSFTNTRNGNAQAVRVFFFDDNINLLLGQTAGAAETKGICNLRDISTGKYVDFSVGSNGFQCDAAYRHTLIHHSDQYRNVLVQANILDAMSNLDYFTSIILKYKKPGEKLIVYMDVNGTILWNDSIMGQGPDEMLLGTMYGFTEVRPRKQFDFKWGGQQPVTLNTAQNLKQLLNDIAKGDNKMLHDFWRKEQSEAFMAMIGQDADLGWVGKPGIFTSEEFFSVYRDYMDELHQQAAKQGAAACGITTSWFRCLAALREGMHAVVINSFGMDTQRVVVRSARDPRKVLHLAINFELWSDRDLKKFKAQFEAEALPPPQQSSNQAPVARFAGCGFDLSCKDRNCPGGACDNSNEALERVLDAQDTTHIFEFVVRKPNPDITLGAKVTHVQQGLEVAQIFSEGAIKEANEINQNMVPPDPVLRAGDIIRQVNGIRGDTKAMVQECKKSVMITFHVFRPTSGKEGGFCSGTSNDPFEEEVINPAGLRKSRKFDQLVMSRMQL